MSLNIDKEFFSSNSYLNIQNVSAFWATLGFDESFQAGKYSFSALNRARSLQPRRQTRCSLFSLLILSLSPKIELKMLNGNKISSRRLLSPKRIRTFGIPWLSLALVALAHHQIFEKLFFSSLEGNWKIQEISRCSSVSAVLSMYIVH